MLQVQCCSAACVPFSDISKKLGHEASAWNERQARFLRLLTWCALLPQISVAWRVTFFRPPTRHCIDLPARPDRRLQFRFIAVIAKQGTPDVTAFALAELDVKPVESIEEFIGVGEDDNWFAVTKIAGQFT